MKSHIFFDLDGVILDSMPYHAKAWILAFREFGLEFTEEEIFLHEGAIELESSLTLFTSKGIKPTPEFFAKAFKLQKRIFKEKFSNNIKPFPEIPEILNNLKKEGRKLSLVTSSSEEILREVFPPTLSQLFEVIITGDKVERRKPHPDPYLKAKEFFGVETAEVAVVENAPAGVLSAKRANLFCIGITTTLKPEYLSMADVIVNNHRELKNFLLNGTSF